MAGPLFLLGPQRPDPNLADVLQGLPGDGPIVTITAGWRVDEGETAALHAVVGERAMHLPLYDWFEECMERMPKTRERYKKRQRELMRLKALYRVRLAFALGAVRELTERSTAEPELVRTQLEHAIEDVRRIDEQFVDNARTVFDAYPEVARPWELPEVRARRQESAEKLSAASAILLAGGHVGVLRNRMLFFGVHQQLFQAWRQNTAVVGWGAGAMVLTDRIVLFYDDPPDGPAHPEIFDTGLAMASNVVMLPDARKRLRLSDSMRVALLAGRFGPDRCIGMENGACLERVGSTWVHRGRAGSTVVLTAAGTLEELTS